MNYLYTVIRVFSFSLSEIFHPANLRVRTRRVVFSFDMWESINLMIRCFHRGVVGRTQIKAIELKNCYSISLIGEVNHNYKINFVDYWLKSRVFRF